MATYTDIEMLTAPPDLVNQLIGASTSLSLPARAAS